MSPQGTVSVPVIPSGATSYHTLAPCRVLDTRNGTGADAAAPALDAGEIRTFDLTGRSGIPAAARALSVNVTVTGPAVDGDLVVYREDLGTPPITSNVSFKVGKTHANNGVAERDRAPFGRRRRLRDGRPGREAKLSATRSDPPLVYFKERLRIPWAYEVTRTGTRDFVEDGVRAVPAARFLPAIV